MAAERPAGPPPMMAISNSVRVTRGERAKKGLGASPWRLVPDSRGSGLVRRTRRQRVNESKRREVGRRDVVHRLLREHQRPPILRVAEAERVSHLVSNDASELDRVERSAAAVVYRDVDLGADDPRVLIDQPGRATDATRVE